MAVKYSTCEWCGRRTAARDQDGDAACAPGRGCAQRPRRPYGLRATVNGLTLTVREWAERCEVAPWTLYREVHLGHDLSTAIARRLELVEQRHRTFGRKGGRLPPRGLTVAAVARSVDLSRSGLYRAAKRAGRSIDEEIALRRAEKAGLA